MSTIDGSYFDNQKVNPEKERLEEVLKGNMQFREKAKKSQKKYNIECKKNKVLESNKLYLGGVSIVSIIGFLILVLYIYINDVGSMDGVESVVETVVETMIESV